MRSVMVTLVLSFTFLPQGHAQEHAASRSADAQVDELIERAIRGLSRHAGLETTTLGKVAAMTPVYPPSLLTGPATAQVQNLQIRQPPVAFQLANSAPPPSADYRDVPKADPAAPVAGVIKLNPKDEDSSRTSSKAAVGFESLNVGKFTVPDSDDSPPNSIGLKLGLPKLRSSGKSSFKAGIAQSLKDLDEAPGLDFRGRIDSNVQSAIYGR